MFHVQNLISMRPVAREGDAPASAPAQQTVTPVTTGRSLIEREATRGLKRWWHQEVARRAARRTLHQAYAAFRAVHPQEDLFDLHFLSGRGAEALEEADAAALARAWAAQFRYRDERRRALDVRRMLPAAEAFINLYAEQRALRTSREKHS